MSIMSTSVVHRRGKPASSLSKNHGDTVNAPQNNDRNGDKKKQTPFGNALEPILVVVLIALVIIICIMLIIPQNGGTNKPAVDHQDASSQHVRREEQRRQPVDKDRENAANAIADDDGVVHQMVFSTGCSTFQDWQSYVFFFHAYQAGQPGQVTRIASGCSPKEAEELKQIFQEQIAPMSNRFHLHLTPDFMEIKPGMRYKFANKPHGLKHWLEHALNMPTSNTHDDDIVILLDPDQMLLRPLTSNFENSIVDWKPTKDGQKPITRVQHGFPAGQLYGFGAQWKTKVNVTHVAGPNSPIEEVTMQQGRDHYALGPPYMGTARDMYSIAGKWCEFLPNVHDNYPHLLAEMFAYSLAAAHNRLPHQVAKSFMVSDPYSGSEGWKLLDDIPSENLCQAAGNRENVKMPYVMHYCQRYLLGKYFIGKYRLPKDFVSCSSPLLLEPPDDIALRYNYSIAPFESEKHYYTKPTFIRRHAFMLCTMIHGLNQASEYFKKNNCPEQDVNWEKSLIFHDTIEDEYD